MKPQKIILFHHIILKPPIRFEDEVMDLFTFTNPVYLDLCNRRGLKKDKRPAGSILSKFKEDGVWKSKRIPELVFYYEVQDNGDLWVPRGAWFKLAPLFKRLKQPVQLINRRKKREFQMFMFHGDLHKEKGQDIILDYDAEDGILEAPTGSGKTVMACWLISHFQRPTIIAVNTLELMNQWTSQIEFFLKEKPGKIGNGIIDIQPITVALIQTLKERPKLLKTFGCLIVDEVHFVATDSYGKIINAFFGKYVIGLSATPKRNDGKTRVMHWYCGKVVTKINYEDAERAPGAIRFIPSSFETKINFRKAYSKALVALCEDEVRNTLIKDTVLDNLDIFGIHLVLSKSSKHLYAIYELLPDHIKLISRVLVGTINKTERVQIVDDMKAGKLKIVLATQQLLGTGFDEPLLSVLHLTTPIKDEERLKQYLGRITRVHPEKEMAYVFDYFDKYISILKKGAQIRSRLYSTLRLSRK